MESIPDNEVTALLKEHSALLERMALALEAIALATEMQIQIIKSKVPMAGVDFK